MLPKNRKIIWSIEKDNLGCSIKAIRNNVAIITAGTQPGQITVRATDSTYTDNYIESKLRLKKRIFRRR